MESSTKESIFKYLTRPFKTSRSRQKKVHENIIRHDIEKIPRKGTYNLTENNHNVTDRRDDIETGNERTTSIRQDTSTPRSIRQDASTSRSICQDASSSRSICHDASSFRSIRHDASTSSEVIHDKTEYANDIKYAYYPIASPTLREVEESAPKKSVYVPTDIWEASKVGNHIAVRRFVMKDPFLAVHPSDNDRTPLFLAAHGGHLKTCSVLLDNGASDPNKECRLGALNDEIAKLIQSRALRGLCTAEIPILTVNSDDESEYQEEMNHGWLCQMIIDLICP